MNKQDGLGQSRGQADLWGPIVVYLSVLCSAEIRLANLY